MTQQEIETAGRALADQLKEEARAELPGTLEEWAFTAALEDSREGLL